MAKTHILHSISLYTVMLPHRDAVRLHRTKLRIRVLCIDRHGHMTSCLVPIKSTWCHFVPLQTQKTHVWESWYIMWCWPDDAKLTVCFLHWCDPLLQPSWDRNELKSDVFLLQQLQYFILKPCMRIKYHLKIWKNCFSTSVINCPHPSWKMGTPGWYEHVSSSVFGPLYVW